MIAAYSSSRVQMLNLALRRAIQLRSECSVFKDECTKGYLPEGEGYLTLHFLT